MLNVEGKSEGDSRVGLAVITNSELQSTARPIRFMPRTCITCGIKINALRLAAAPNARQCVLCLSAAGDVTPAREYSVRCSLNNSELLSDLTEAPILPVKCNVTGEQTTAEIISGVDELDIERG